MLVVGGVEDAGAVVAGGKEVRLAWEDQSPVV